VQIACSILNSVLFASFTLQLPLSRLTEILEMPGPRPSKRFSPWGLSEILVPFVLVILVLGLLAVLVVTGLSLLGWTPAF
jgi:hypothetical protein